MTYFSKAILIDGGKKSESEICQLKECKGKLIIKTNEILKDLVKGLEEELENKELQPVIILFEMDKSRTRKSGCSIVATPFSLTINIL